MDHRVHPHANDLLRCSWEVIHLEDADVDIDFPEEVSTTSSSGSGSRATSEASVDFPEEDGSMSSNSEFFVDDDDCSVYTCWPYTDDEDPVEDEPLPGVDYKYSLEPTRSRNEALNMRTYHGQACLTSYLRKEFGKAANVSKLQNAFAGFAEKAAVLGEKSLSHTTDSITVTFTSPLKGISSPIYIDKMQNFEIAKELPMSLDESSCVMKEARPSVIAVNLKWKNGLRICESNDFVSKIRRLEPLMRRSRFVYHSKPKFAALMKSTCDEVFPEWRQNLVVINGQEGTPQISISSDIHADSHTPEVVRNFPVRRGDPRSGVCKEYKDFKEHKILVVPHHSKRRGFDVDLSKRFEFAYEVKFIVEGRDYQHKFLLQLPLSKLPQHYGLIFTFPEDPNGHSKLRIKALLTVYSIYPKSSEFACLQTYETRNFEETTFDRDISNDISGRRHVQCLKAARNAVQLMTNNLNEDKLARSLFGPLSVDRNFVFKGQGAHVYKNGPYYWERNKNGNKNLVRKEIKFLLRDLHADRNFDRGPAASFEY